MNARGGKGDQSKDGPRKMPGGWILGFLLGIAVSLAACAVLYPTVTEFNATSLLAYASMTVGQGLNG